MVVIRTCSLMFHPHVQGGRHLTSSGVTVVPCSCVIQSDYVAMVKLQRHVHMF